MEKVFLLSIGTAVPSNRLSQCHYFDCLAKNSYDSKHKRLLNLISNRTGIEGRYSVLTDFIDKNSSSGIFNNNITRKGVPGIGRRMEIFEEHALDLSIKSIEDCLDSIPKLEKSAITHLVTFSCTGMYAPGIDMGIIEKMNLNKAIERTCINFMGCYAAVVAIKTAYHIVRSEPEAVVLLSGVELCSLHYRNSEDPEQLVANAIFGDGAAAVIICGEKKRREAGIQAFKLENFYSLFSPEGKNEMTWRIGDFSFELFLSSYVPRLLNEELEYLANKLIEKSGIKVSDISYYAIHPGGMAILKACEKALNLTSDHNSYAYKILSEYGNMSSVTLLFLLKEILNDINLNDTGKNILSFAFGPGLTIESMILKVS